MANHYHPDTVLGQAYKQKYIIEYNKKNKVIKVMHNICSEINKVDKIMKNNWKTVMKSLEK